MFFSHNQYPFSLIFSGNPKESHTDQVYYKFFYSVWKNNSQTFKSIATAKNLSPVCMFLVQVASINYFYSIWQLEDNVFKSSLLSWGSFQPPCSCVAWNEWCKISPCFNFYLHNTNTKIKVQCKYQSSIIKLSNTKLKTLYGVFDHTCWTFLTTFIFWCTTLFLYKWL